MYTQKPRPGRRRLFSSVLVSILTLSLALPASARPSPSPNTPSLDEQLFNEYAARGGIHTAPLLHRRQDLGDGNRPSSSSTTIETPTSQISTETSRPSSDSSSEPSSDASITISATSTDTQQTTIPTATTSTSSNDSPLPRPFDTSLGSNFTTPSCPTFFTTFLSNTTLQQCYPLSLLLQNSASFITAQRSPSTLQNLLSTSCAAPLSICAATLTDIAGQLLLDSNCGADWKRGQPLVVQAYKGLVGYEAVADATCLTTTDYNSTDPADVSPSTSSTLEKGEQYCFATAITSRSSTGDPWAYYTAIGMNLPTVAQPSCNACLKQVMAGYASWAVRREQPVSETYLGAAGVINGHCGEGFVQMEEVKVGSQGEAVSKVQGVSGAGRNGGGGGGLGLVAAVVVGVVVAML